MREERKTSRSVGSGQGLPSSGQVRANLLTIRVGAIGASPCIVELVLAYLFNLSVPTEGVSFPAQPISFTSTMQTSPEADLNQMLFRSFLPLIKR